MDNLKVDVKAILKRVDASKKALKAADLKKEQREDAKKILTDISEYIRKYHASSSNKVVYSIITKLLIDELIDG